MILRWQEAAFPLVFVVVLLIGKHLPVLDPSLLSRLAGIVCFSYAIFLSLRLVQAEEAVFRNGWSQLRPSPLELICAVTASAFAALLMGSVVLGDPALGTTGRIMAVMVLSVAFAAGAAVITMTSLMVRVRWNRHRIEHRNSLGRTINIDWADVTAVRTHWHGVTIWTSGKARISFSPYQSGAAELMRQARYRAARNAATVKPRLWPVVE